MRTQLRLLFSILFFLGVALSHRGLLLSPKEESKRSPASIEHVKMESVEPELDAKPLKKKESFRFLRAIHAVQGKKELMSLKLAGSVSLTTLKETEKEVTLYVQFEMKSNAQKQSIQSSLPIVLVLTKDFTKAILKSPDPKDKREEDELNLVKDFVTLYAYQMGEDTTGKYQFSWKPLGLGGEKVKTAYENQKIGKIKILTSIHQVKWNDDRSILKIIGKDEVLLSGTSQTVEMKMTASYGIERESVQLGVTSISPQLPDFFKVQSFALSSNFSKVEVQNYASLEKQIDQLSKMNKNERMHLYHELVKALKGDPDQVNAFRKKIELLQSDVETLSFGIGVLSTAATEQAQAVLRDWFRSYNSNHDIGHQILNGLALTQAALTAETRSFLLEILNDKEHPDYLENAAYTLGASLKKVNDPEVRNQLITLYQEASNSDVRAMLVDSMGNSGDPQFAPLIQASLRSPSAREREKAVFAARLLSPQHAYPVLMVGYADQDPAVRHAAIWAISFQSDFKPYENLVKSCARSGNSECIELLAKKQ